MNQKKTCLSTLLLLTALGLFACGKQAEEPSAETEAPGETAPPPEAAPAPTVGPIDISDALADPARPDADRERDAGRRPAEVIAFLGIEPSMSVLDLIAGGGYYTEVLSAAVGPDGTVYSQNPKVVLELRDGINDKTLTARLADNRLSNVERMDKEIGEMGFEPGSLDAAFTALNFHDVYYLRSPEAAAGMLSLMYAALKPGGMLAIVDHAGDPEADNASLHRVHEGIVTEAATSAGFVIEASSDVLRNPEDDHSLNVFDDAIRGNTDRFVLRLRKPGEIS